MYAIACVHQTGGGCVAKGETLEAVKADAQALMAMPHVKGHYVFCTIPYEMKQINNDKFGLLWNCALPAEFATHIAPMFALFYK